jgi:hypothetical protein
MSGTTTRRVSAEQVRGVMHDPPDFIAMSYLPAWRSGRFSTRGLACGVVAALGMSVYDPGLVDEVTSILVSLGYGNEAVSAVWA